MSVRQRRAVGRTLGWQVEAEAGAGDRSEASRDKITTQVGWQDEGLGRGGNDVYSLFA